MNAETNVNEKPIIMSAFSVQAILDGRKTQTRRVIKSPGNHRHINRLLGEWGLSAPPYQYDGEEWMPGERLPWNWTGSRPPNIGDWVWELQSDVDDHVTTPIRCPYGKPGDHLWVRETWATPGNFDHIKPSLLPETHFDDSLLVYRATAENAEPYYTWRPSIFMPRWASRITLRVTGVRVERVQDISQEDAQAEGIERGTYTNKGHDGWWYDYVDQFRLLWDSINAKHGFGWGANPWVFVIEFEKAEKETE